MNNTHSKSTPKSKKDTVPARGIRVSQSFVFGQRMADIANIRTELGLSLPLGADARMALARTAGLANDAELAAIALMAEKGNGTVAGIAVDAEKTRETIAYVAASQAFEHEIESLLIACRDERLRRRAEVAAPANLARQAMRVLAKSDGLSGMAHEVAHLRTLGSHVRRARKAGVDAATTSSPTAVAPIANDPIAGSG